MTLSRDIAIDRRRAQNRLAQRRFRWKQNQKNRVAAKEFEDQHDGNPTHLNTPSQQPSAPTPTVSNPISSPPQLVPGLHDANPSANPAIRLCRFSLLGNRALLGISSWSTGSVSTTGTAPLDVTSITYTGQLSQDISVEPARQNPETSSRLTFVRSGSVEILQTLTPDSICPAELERRHTSPKETPWRPQLNYATSMVPPTPQDVATIWPTGAPAPAKLISPSDSGSSTGGGARWLGSLHIAAQKGHDRIVRVLLEQEMDCNEKDSDGLTPLYYAIMGGFDDIAISLVEHGARVDQVDSQQRHALHWAVLGRREGLLRLLLEHCDDNQAFINSYDSVGMTAFHIAVDAGFEAGVKLLLQYGANPNHRARKN